MRQSPRQSCLQRRAHGPTVFPPQENSDFAPAISSDNLPLPESAVRACKHSPAPSPRRSIQARAPAPAYIPVPPQQIYFPAPEAYRRQNGAQLLFAEAPPRAGKRPELLLASTLPASAREQAMPGIGLPPHDLKASAGWQPAKIPPHRAAKSWPIAILDSNWIRRRPASPPPTRDKPQSTRQRCPLHFPQNPDRTIRHNL